MKEGLRWVLRKWVSWVWVVVESEIVGRGGEEDGSGGGMRAAVSVVGGLVRGEEEEGWTGFEMGFGSFFNTIVARSTLLETHDFKIGTCILVRHLQRCPYFCVEKKFTILCNGVIWIELE